MPAPTLQIVVASTRPGRIGRSVADWFHALAKDHAAFDVELVDLADVDLPLFDEPAHPRLRQYEHQHTKEWSATISRADAFVFVMPEYNHAYNAALKNALDFLVHEWAYKPVGTVSYGGVAAGTRAWQQLKPVLAALKMTPMMEAVHIPFVHQHKDADGRFQGDEPMEQASGAMLDELARWTDALRALRTA
jgi:NAD(P)H-dependent FMN reductase